MLEVAVVSVLPAALALGLQASQDRFLPRVEAVDLPTVQRRRRVAAALVSLLAAQQPRPAPARAEPTAAAPVLPVRAAWQEREEPADR